MGYILIYACCTIPVTKKANSFFIVTFDSYDGDSQ